MKKGIFLALMLFASAAFLAAAELYRPSSLVPPTPEREFRGAWIATVANKDWPSAPGLSVAEQKAELISLLDTAARLKLNAVVFQVRPAGDAMYGSPDAPWSIYLTGIQGLAPQPYYDPLAFAIAEAHKRGLELHAWFNPFRVRLAPASMAANSVARTHPEWVRNYGGQLWLDPGEPGAREYVVRIIMDVVRRYDVDGVQFDDYFYPYPAPDKGPRQPFPDNASWTRYGERSGMTRDDWRRRNINEFIESVYQNIKAAKPWVEFGISPFGIWQPGYPPPVRGFNSYAELYGDSRLWLMNGWLDYISPQLYWPVDAPAQSFPVLLNWWARQNVKGRHLWPGLAANKLLPAEIAEQIHAIRSQAGAGGEIFFELRDLKLNAALARVIASEYREPALVPASPWLASSWPAKPALAGRENRGAWMFQWSAPGENSLAKWLLQYQGMDSVWRTIMLPGYQTTETFSFPPRAVSVRLMDRAGNLGAPAVVSGAAEETPAPSRSFWGSFKGK